VREGGRELRLVHLLDAGAAVRCRADPVGRVNAVHQAGEPTALLDEDDGAALDAGDAAGPRAVTALGPEGRGGEVGDDGGVVEERQLELPARRAGERVGVDLDGAHTRDTDLVALDLVGRGLGVDEGGRLVVVDRPHGGSTRSVDGPAGPGVHLPGRGTRRGGIGGRSGRCRRRRHGQCAGRDDGDGGCRQRRTAVPPRER
jgi:hypothetical protein